MPQYQQGSGTYNGVGAPAGAATRSGPTGAPDPASVQPLPCPLDGSPCYIIGSQSNPWRCQAQGHQWALVPGSNPVVPGVYYLVSPGYVTVSLGILQPTIPFSTPVTLLNTTNKNVSRVSMGRAGSKAS
jgi:hypothetical protein